MSDRKSLMNSAFEAMVNARTRQAKAYVNGALLMLDEETLKAHGYDRTELEKKHTAFYPF